MDLAREFLMNRAVLQDSPRESVRLFTYSNVYNKYVNVGDTKLGRSMNLHWMKAESEK
ncbi:MAG: hypothetical protein ACTSPV_18860 [Candidatus Hodarchaeales archaeon]